MAENLRAAVGQLVRAARTTDTLPSGEAAVLGHLDREGPATTAELASWRRIRHQSAARSVKELVDAGLVRPAPHESDGRKIVLHITAAGRERLDRQRRARADRLAAAIDDALDPAERAELARSVELLTRLTDHLRRDP
ncbi:MarR family transcriptional regulator [Amycolatopsis sp. PS_44_ISF1]|uniref:MarR family winged helix-turn-helix transcriptional regulator n=1 Tax=Amycolatopsis sp. PS_44_ISF1 TaxID=2974917 RepID=UPI0028DDC620|nr:MarR family transcriptional regulator [Amycolatopsis sp. PS_44_ISF1]MDT8909308.1 MarR family transcriptional regulator [Amycolatopsis sp. PS_44_ISF1]